MRVDPATGVVSVYMPFDFERTKRFPFKVRVSDDDKVPFHNDAELEVVVRNISERPTRISLSGSLSISKNVAENTVVGALTTTDPDVG